MSQPVMTSLRSHLTPMTSIFSSFARSKRSLLVLSVAPNLTLRRQTALESSVAMQNQLCLWMCSGDFHQFNFTVKSHHLDSITGSILDLRHLFTKMCIGNPLSDTQSPCTNCISVLLAQSNPVPMAARVLSRALLSLRLSF